MRKNGFVLGLVVLLFTLLAPSVWAQDEVPPTEPPRLTLFASYPAQEVAIGENVTFDLTLRAGASAETVWLGLEGAPAEWTATFRGDGKIIRAAYVEPENTLPLQLRLELPQDVSSGTYRFTVVGQGEKERAELDLEVTVREKTPPKLVFEVDLPTLRGGADTAFRYNVTLRNEGDEDLSVNLIAEAPPEFLVTFRLTGSEVTSIPIEGNQSKRLSVEVEAFTEVPAGVYPITVIAQAGSTQATTRLAAEVTGRPDLVLSTPDGRLSGDAYAGTETTIQVTLGNNGSAPAHNIQLSASQPSGWTVSFEPAQVPQLAAGESTEVSVHMQPAEKAVAGDYMVTLRVRPEDGTGESVDFRVTVRTSTLWGVVGIALIGIAVVVVALAVMRFGRR